MKLADFIRQNLHAILDDWDRFASQIASAGEMDRRALRDHASGILLVIADDLDQPQTEGERSDKSKGHGPRGPLDTEAEKHGGARLAEGFSVNDSMSEFRALRASVQRQWKHSAPLDLGAIDELTRFHEAIDQALSESMARFTADKERNSTLFDALLSATPDLNCLIDIDGTIIYANKSLSQRFGVPVSEMLNKSFYDLPTPENAQFRPQVERAINLKAVVRGEFTHTPLSGEKADYEYLVIPVCEAPGVVQAVAITAHDITERKASEARIRRCADYDGLTGLPNRNLFLDRLRHEVKRSTRTGLPLALMFIDLDGFKEVNDKLGHAAGDQLLQMAGQRIRACVRESDTVARLGGDEFTVILTEVKNVPHVDIVAQQILDQLAKPFTVFDTEAQISASIGITFAPQDASRPDALIQNADQAMYAAKSAGRNRFSFFTCDLRDSAWARHRIISELHEALPRHQMAVFYQPIVDLATGKITRAEAQLRWLHPRTGLMHPAGFIDLAEEIGLLGEIDDWVLQDAVQRVKVWSAITGAPFQISVNASPLKVHGKTSHHLSHEQLAQLESVRGCICLEIAEEAFLSDSPAVRAKLNELQGAGVILGIDGFGIGFSSITCLRKFGLDFLKIHPSFARDATHNQDMRILVDAIIVMAHKLGLEVVGQGVESAEQAEWIRAAGCDFAQGYLFSEPVAPGEFEKMLTPASQAERPRV